MKKELLKRDFRVTSILFLIMIIYEIVSNRLHGLILLLSYPGISVIFMPVLTIAIIGVIFQFFLWSKIGKTIGYNFNLNLPRMTLNVIYIFILTILFFMFLSGEFISSVLDNNTFDFTILFITFLIFYFLSALIFLFYDKFRKGKKKR